jgi:hypothetical protein
MIQARQSSTGADPATSHPTTHEGRHHEAQERTSPSPEELVRRIPQTKEDAKRWLDFVAHRSGATLRRYRVAEYLVDRFLASQTGELFPGYQSIAATKGFNKSDVSRSIKWLKDAGLIASWIGSRTVRGGRLTEYALLWPPQSVGSSATLSAERVGGGRPESVGEGSDGIEEEPKKGNYSPTRVSARASFLDSSGEGHMPLPITGSQPESAHLRRAGCTPDSYEPSPEVLHDVARILHEIGALHAIDENGQPARALVQKYRDYLRIRGPACWPADFDAGLRMWARNERRYRPTDASADSHVRRHRHSDRTQFLEAGRPATAVNRMRAAIHEPD